MVPPSVGGSRSRVQSWQQRGRRGRLRPCPVACKPRTGIRTGRGGACGRAGTLMGCVCVCMCLIAQLVLCSSGITSQSRQYAWELVSMLSLRFLCAHASARHTHSLSPIPCQSKTLHKAQTLTLKEDSLGGSLSKRCYNERGYLKQRGLQLTTAQQERMRARSRDAPYPAPASFRAGTGSFAKTTSSWMAVRYTRCSRSGSSDPRLPPPPAASSRGWDSASRSSSLSSCRTSEHKR